MPGERRGAAREGVDHAFVVVVGLDAPRQIVNPKTIRMEWTVRIGHVVRDATERLVKLSKGSEVVGARAADEAPPKHLDLRLLLFDGARCVPCYDHVRG